MDKLVEQGRGPGIFHVCPPGKKGSCRQREETIIGKRALMRIKQTNPESAAPLTAALSLQDSYKGLFNPPDL